MSEKKDSFSFEMTAQDVKWFSKQFKKLKKDMQQQVFIVVRSGKVLFCRTTMARLCTQKTVESSIQGQGSGVALVEADIILSTEPPFKVSYNGTSIKIGGLTRKYKEVDGDLQLINMGHAEVAYSGTVS